MAVTHATALKQDFYNLETGQTTVTYAPGSTQKLIVYSGTPPANASTALGSNTAIATLTSLVWGAPTAGAGTLSATADSSAVGGVAAFYRTTKSDGTTCISQGSVTATGGGGDCIINSTTIAAGANVSLTGSNTLTACP